MRVWKKMFAVFLAVSLVGTAVPPTLLAAPVNEVEQAGTAGSNTGETAEGNLQGQPIVSPQEGREGQKKTAPSKARSASSMSREMAENYITVTVGQESRQTTGEQQEYLFAPEESGYYRLACESVNGQEFYFQATKCIYYTEDENGVPVQEDYNMYYGVTDKKMERIVWLNQEEQYVFHYQAASNYTTDEYDFRLQMDKVEIKDISVAQNPTIDSYNFLNYTGMQVSVNFADGSSTLSGVTSDKYNRNCYVKAFEWQYVAYDRQGGIEPWAYLQSVDSQENSSQVDFDTLAMGSHTAELQIREYAGNTQASYDFQMQFTVQKGNVKTLVIENPQTEYTQDFNEELGEFELLASYNDGTEDKVLPSSDAEISRR